MPGWNMLPPPVASKLIMEGLGRLVGVLIDVDFLEVAWWAQSTPNANLIQSPFDSIGQDGETSAHAGWTLNVATQFVKGRLQGFVQCLGLDDDVRVRACPLL